MNHFEKEKLARSGEISKEAIHRRLVAIRESTQIAGKALAADADLPYTTFRSQEESGSPSLKMLAFYWRKFEIDPNFIMGGDFSKIHPDTAEAILAELAALEAKAPGK